MFTIAVCLFFGIVWRGLICSPCVFLCLMKSGRFAKYTETIHQTVHSASIAISLNCNAPKHLFCLCLGSEIFRKCQDEQAWLSPLSATVKMWGISHLEQAARHVVSSITQNGCFCFSMSTLKGYWWVNTKSALYVKGKKVHPFKFTLPLLSKVPFNHSRVCVWWNQALRALSHPFSSSPWSMTYLKLIILCLLRPREVHFFDKMQSGYFNKGLIEPF